MENSLESWRESHERSLYRHPDDELSFLGFVGGMLFLILCMMAFSLIVLVPLSLLFLSCAYAWKIILELWYHFSLDLFVALLGSLIAVRFTYWLTKKAFNVI